VNLLALYLSIFALFVVQLFCDRSIPPLLVTKTTSRRFGWQRGRTRWSVCEGATPSGRFFAFEKAWNGDHTPDHNESW